MADAQNKYYSGFVINLNHFALPAILLVSFILRFMAIDFQSLWLDELYTMNMADPNNSWADIYRLSFSHDPLSVLYFFLLNLFFKIFGFTAFVARFFSLLFGLAGIAATYSLGTRLSNKRVGLIAAFLLALNPFHIEYSQEARVYTMYLFASALSFLALLRYIKASSHLNAFLYGLSILFLLLSHFFGFFVLVAHCCLYIFFAFRNKLGTKQFVKHALIISTTTIIGYLPVVPIFLMLTKNEGTWIAPPGRDALFRLYVDFQGNDWYLAIIGLVFMSFLVLAVKTKHSNYKDPLAFKLSDQLILLVVWILISFFIPYLLSVYKFPIFYKRYMISYLPAFVILSALGLSQLNNMAWRFVLLLSFVVFTWYHLFPMSHYYSNPRKADFRGISETVLHLNAPKHAVFTSLPYHFGYYFRQANQAAMIQSGNLDSICNAQRSGRLPLQDFWFIDAHGRNFSVSEINQKFLDSTFILFAYEQRHDAWARWYIRKTPTDSTQVLVMTRSNFYNAQGQSSGALYDNSSLISEPKTIKEALYEINLRSISTPVNAINSSGAKLAVYANSKLLKVLMINENSFSQGDTMMYYHGAKEPLRLELKFLNDTSSGPWDRNFILRDISLKESN